MIKMLMLSIMVFSLTAVYAGGLPEDVVEEPKVKATYTDMSDVKPIILPPRPTKPIAPLFVPIEEIGSPIPPKVEEEEVDVASVAPVVAPIAAASFFDDFFLEAGAGVGTTRESINFTNKCGGKECNADSHTNIPVFGRVGYNVNDAIDVYTELAASRSSIIGKTVENADLSLGARYTAYDAFKIFGSIGKQKTTVNTTKLRNIYKLGAGYNVNDDISCELIFHQTDKAKFKDYNLKSRGAALFLVYNF